MSTDNCGNTKYPRPCPIPGPPPIDGRGGLCYNTLFPVPTCDYAWSPTNPIPLSQDPRITWSILDKYYSNQASLSALHGIALGLALTTLLNVLVLTPARKRVFLVHWAVLLGTTLQVLRSVVAIYLRVWGIGGSTYLQITSDWSSTELSATWRGLVFVQQMAGCLDVAAVHVAFWCQCRGLLVWVRLRKGKNVYWGVLGGLSGIAGVSWGIRVAFAVYQIYWVANASEGRWIVEMSHQRAFNVLTVGTTVSVGISFGCWSLVFVGSAGWMLYERRKVVVGGALRVKESGKRRIQSVCEKALNLIGFVGVESFVIPLCFAIASASSVTPATETLLVSTILALLPLSSLFIQGSQNENVPQRPDHLEQLHILSQPDVAGSSEVDHIGLDSAKREDESANQPAKRTGVSAGLLVDRELREIDSMM